jgi:hypothetical protein
LQLANRVLVVIKNHNIHADIVPASRGSMLGCWPEFLGQVYKRSARVPRA